MENELENSNNKLEKEINRKIDIMILLGVLILLILVIIIGLLVKGSSII